MDWQVRGPIRMDTSADIFTPHCTCYIVDIFCILHNIENLCGTYYILRYAARVFPSDRLMSNRPCILCAATSAAHMCQTTFLISRQVYTWPMFGLPSHSTLCHSNTSSTLDSCLTSVSVVCSAEWSPHRCSILFIYPLNWSAAECKIDEGLQTTVKGWVKQSTKWRHGMYML